MFSFFKIINSSEITKGISSYYLIKGIFYLIPSILLITIPFSIVFAVFFSVGEISMHGEFIAIRVGGFSYLEIVKLMFIFTFIISIFYYIIAGYIDPFYSYKSKEYIRIMINRITNINIKENIFTGISSFVIKPGYVDGNHMKDIMMIRDFDYDDNGHIIRVDAKEGDFRLIKENGIEIFLLDGEITHIPKSNSEVINKGSFGSYYVFIPFELREVLYNIPYKHMKTSKLKMLLFYETDILKRNMIKKEIYNRIAKSVSIIVFFIISILFSFYYEKESRYFSFISSLLILFFYYSFSILCNLAFRRNTSLFYIDFLTPIFMVFISFYFYFFKLRFK